MGQVKLQQIKQQIKELLVMRKQLEGILKDWDTRLARTRKGTPARLLESLPNGLRRLDLAPRLKTNRKESRL
jgi:hypothetical protein